MSAFVVDPETMDRCVRAICFGKGAYGHPHVNRFAGIDTTQTDAPTNIGRLLYTMNCEAVSQRYREEPSTFGTDYIAFQASPNRLRPQTLADKVADLKSLQCLEYQCSEGDVMNNALFAELRSAIGAIAAGILSTLPEYEAAPWG
jgi:hypothetical protein